MTVQQFFDIPGGIHPAERKELSNRTPILRAPLPARLILPLSQHIGAPAEPCVSVGQRVLKGQLIAEATGVVSAPVHASSSGTVSFIGPQPFPHVSGMLAPAIVIDTDGLDEWTELQPCPHFAQVSDRELLDRIRQAGISGLGGASFPTAVKLAARPQQKIHTLIINGTECEPYITADDLLIRAQAAELLAVAPSNVVAVEVNLSCPNLEGRGSIFAHDARLSAEVMAATAACGRPRWAKLSANTDRIIDVADAVIANL